ncbi:hypothetical protein LzC2_03560 [Planctomycetes bacterium LzC2]|uniref:Glycosyltransferase 2-like domain-containing protein n=2 Tax=Alienimonas chondri TaxID=2681879 RepID=A0ABX1V8C7_9PLAN|nr:hypothetical protein [Alienimonas chondri]
MREKPLRRAIRQRSAGRTGPAAVVTVPARDEEENMPPLMEALASQGGLAGRDFFEVFVLANNCMDRTAAAAQHYGRRAGLVVRTANVSLPADVAHVGTARRLLARAALQRIADDRGPGGGAVLTTDADTKPAVDWVAENLRALREGADCVCGRVLVEAPDPADLIGRRAARWHGLRRRHRRLSDRLAWLIDPEPDDPWPRHTDEAGASLAITAEALRRCGGFPALRCGEDRALADAVRRAGGRVRHDPRVSVRTSRRRDGRCPGGLADLLTRLGSASSSDQSETDRLVEDPRRWERRLHVRAALRRIWSRPPAPAERYETHGLLDRTALARRHAAGEPFGGIVADLNAAHDPPTVPLKDAVQRLSDRVAQLTVRREPPCQSAFSNRSIR